ncbi:MAG TPA: hypothetical protein DIT29_00385 [Pseudothermotoga sp.]|nr:nucleoside hydrolase [Pseudothermotoga sp.]HBT39436.1 hypothetical protein [Pseudothermotoga sp.]HCO97171.1 hypothetical protein [Pseudothermotoga sp.]
MRIILDCDPGHDDAFAILLAAASEEIELLGVTTVAGNSYLENTTLNARKVLDLFDLDVPVFPGCARPLFRNVVVAPQIHGQSGLDGATVPPPKRGIQKTHAVDFIAEVARKYEDLILVPTGPLTNVALFMLRYPELVKRISMIVLMGGGIAFGNVTPVAEFNIFADPGLGSTYYVDLLKALRSGASTEQISDMIKTAVEKKPLVHHMRDTQIDNEMYKLGG